MTQQPFTPEGVARKQAELNSLSPGDLNTQANLVQDHFKDWVRDNFSLTADQDHYVENMNEEFLGFLSTELSGSIRIKTPITLIKEDPPLAVSSSKRFRMKKNLIFYLEDGVFHPDIATLLLEISYHRK